MQTLTVQITHNDALKTLHALEEKRFIKIVTDPQLDSPALPGEQLNLVAFKTWITNAENDQSIDLKAAKTKWAHRKKQLQKISR